MPKINFTGPAGRIEGQYKISAKKNPPIALVLHPHPQQGGTMNNKITYYMYKMFAQRGFTTLRFNFRGVGKSEGEFDGGDGELADAAAAMDWLQDMNPDAPAVMCAGFSFGAWIAMRLLMRRPEIDHYISISPPANKYEFDFLAPCPVPGLIVQGDQDEIVPEEAAYSVVELIRDQEKPVIYKIIEGADHFYHSHLDQLIETCGNYVDERMEELLGTQY
jgi:alpha/beta superfamily hydrolase